MRTIATYAGVLLSTVALSACSSSDGEPGPAGEDGDMGAMGRMGAEGDPGEPGERGAQGMPGEAGEPGDPGEPGEPGDSGEMGATGATGASGDDGEDGASGLVSVTEEVPGANCTVGGQRIDVGLDTDGDDTLDDDEIVNTTFVCNAVGILLEASEIVPGSECATGGRRIETGHDANGNDVLDDEEVDDAATVVVCNGENVDPAYLERQLMAAKYVVPQYRETLSDALVDDAPEATDALVLTQVGRTPWDVSRFDEGAAEISAFNPATNQLYTINSFDDVVEVFTISAAGVPSADPSIDVSVDVPTVDDLNSVAVFDDGAGQQVLAVAVQVEDDVTEEQLPGFVALYDVTTTTPAFLAAVQVGPQPDMVTFTPDGGKLLSANEGEPVSDYSVDPEGSVSVISMPALGWLDAGNVAPAVTNIDFRDFNVGGAREAEFPSDGRHVGPSSSTRAQALEPEYIAVSPDGSEAWVTLQEQNAIAVIDLGSDSISSIFSLGLKDGFLPGNEFDASDRDDAIAIVRWPVWMMYQPDAIAAADIGGDTYYVTANEGDTKDTDAFAEESRVSSITLDPTAFPDAAVWQQNELLGRLTISNIMGDTDDDGDYDELFAFGGRSFSIWDATGTLVFDSGNQLEVITASLFGEDFNNDNTESAPDSRGDAKGPEPEAVAVGVVAGRTYAFIGMERVGGIAVFDIETPTAPEFVTYVNNRDFGIELDPDDPGAAGDVGDLGPEGLAFVAASDSPTGSDLLIVSNEISGTVTLYDVSVGP